MNKYFQHCFYNIILHKTIVSTLIAIVFFVFILSACVKRNIEPKKSDKSLYEDNYDKIIKPSSTIAPVVDGRGRLISFGSANNSSVKEILPKNNVNLNSATTNNKVKLAPVTDNTGISTNSTTTLSTTNSRNKESEIIDKTTKYSSDIDSEDIYGNNYYQDNDSSYKAYTRSIITKQNDDEYYPLYKYGEKGTIDSSTDSHTKGVYEAFPTDNAVPFTDNEDDFYNDTFLYEY